MYRVLWYEKLKRMHSLKTKKNRKAETSYDTFEKHFTQTVLQCFILEAPLVASVPASCFCFFLWCISTAWYPDYSTLLICTHFLFFPGICLVCYWANTIAPPKCSWWVRKTQSLRHLQRNNTVTVKPAEGMLDVCIASCTIGQRVGTILSLACQCSASFICHIGLSQ